MEPVALGLVSFAELKTFKIAADLCHKKIGSIDSAGHDAAANAASRNRY